MYFQVIRNLGMFYFLKKYYVCLQGQSFMLHQIRKMVGLSLAVVRGLTGEETIDRCWTVDRLDVPTAPGLGLVLDQVIYYFIQVKSHSKLECLSTQVLGKVAY